MTALTLLLWGSWPAPAGAQATIKAQSAPSAKAETRVVPLANDGPAPILPSQTLVIVADAEANAKPQQLREQISFGVTQVLRGEHRLGADEKFPEKNVIPTALSRERYDLLRRFISDGLLPDEQEDDEAMLERDRNAWRLNLGGPYTLEKVTVEYANTKDAKAAPAPETFVSGDADGRIKPIAVGRYLLDVSPRGNKAPEIQPVRFLIDSYDGENQRPEQRLEVPKENTYWQVVIQGFPGDVDQKKLWKTLATDPRIANKITNMEMSERKLMLGSMLLKPNVGTTDLVDNKLIFRFYPPTETTPSRVWMKFPLDADEVEAELAKYREQTTFGLPRQIVKEGPARASDEVKLLPRPSPARWYEILPTPEGNAFRREIELGKIAEWQANADRSPHYLIVWQLDDGWNDRTNEFKDANAYEIDYGPAANLKSTVRAEELTNWAPLIRRARPPAADR